MDCRGNRRDLANWNHPLHRGQGKHAAKARNQPDDLCSATGFRPANHNQPFVVLIPESTINDITSRVRLSEIAGDYFSVKRRGHQYVACCPFHNEKSPSFYINDSKNVYKCWGCGAGGGVFRFVMDMERISFPDAVKKLGARIGIVVEEEESEESKQRKKIESALYSASKFFFEQLIGPNGSEARRQLKARGFTKEICEAWGIGYAPASYSLSGNPEILRAAGLLLDGGCPKFRERVMFSICDETGKTCGFSGRTTANHAAKYLNSPDSKLFSKGKLLYGLHKAKRDIIDSGKVVIVEGQVDAIRCHLNGIKNVVAPLGTAFTNHHCQTIRRLCGEVVLVLDADKAGKEAARKIFCALAPMGVDVKSVLLPDGKDPDQYILDGGNLSELIDNARGYVDSLADGMAGKIETAEERLKAARQIGAAISNLDEGIIRDAVVSSVAPKLGVSIGELNKHVSMRGGHASVPTESKKEVSEAVKTLIAHAIYHGKSEIQKYNWEITGDEDVKSLIHSEFDHTNQSSVAALLAGMKPEIESYLVDTSPESVKSAPIREIYRSLLGLELKKKTEEVARGGNIKDLVPLLEEYKKI